MFQVPHLSWKTVVHELDYHGFVVPSSDGLRILMAGLRKGITASGSSFPIDELVYRQWKNTEGQLSWIMQALKHPEVFCLADYISDPVDLEILKNPNNPNPDIAIWKSSRLGQTLLKLSEMGHYQRVSEMFNIPFLPVQQIQGR